MRTGTKSIVIMGLVTVAAAVPNYLAYQIIGWLGVAVLGLLIAFVAVQAELDNDGPIGSQQIANLYAESQRNRDRMSRAEKAADRSEKAPTLKALNVAKIVGAILIIIGMVGFFLPQVHR